MALAHVQISFLYLFQKIEKTDNRYVDAPYHM